MYCTALMRIVIVHNWIELQKKLELQDMYIFVMHRFLIILSSELYWYVVYWSHVNKTQQFSNFSQ